MNPCRFEKSVWLAAAPEAVFEFHQDPHNITRISPPSLVVVSVEADPVAQVGGRFTLHLRQLGIPMSWVGEWEHVQRPVALVDRAVKSPFRVFRHEHLFVAEGDGTRMTDRVTYVLPFGILGWFASMTAVRIVLMAMFRQRHAATQQFFATGA